MENLNFLKALCDTDSPHLASLRGSGGGYYFGFNVSRLRHKVASVLSTAHIWTNERLHSTAIPNLCYSKVSILILPLPAAN